MQSLKVYLPADSTMYILATLLLFDAVTIHKEIWATGHIYLFQVRSTQSQTHLGRGLNGG